MAKAHVTIRQLKQEGKHPAQAESIQSHARLQVFLEAVIFVLIFASAFCLVALAGWQRLRLALPCTSDEWDRAHPH